MNGRLYGVADGMGGHKGGEVASAGAVAVIGEMLCGLTPDEKRLETGIQAANRRLYEQQAADKALEGMGTTVTVLWEGETHVLIGHVGDSRAYLFRDGAFSQITQDHSVVAEMMRQGILTKEKAKKHPYRNVITRAVGTGTTAAATFTTSPYIAQTAGTVYGTNFSFNAATGVTTPAAATTLVNSPIATVCFACHDDSLSQQHMKANGGSLYAPRSTALATAETCPLCHFSGKVADIAVMHSKFTK
jgi:hypothetical protein